MLRSPLPLRTLKFPGNPIADRGCAAVFEALEGNPNCKLGVLDLYECPTTERGEGPMAANIRANTTVHQVNQVLVRGQEQVNLSQRGARLTDPRNPLRLDSIDSEG